MVVDTEAVVAAGDSDAEFWAESSAEFLADMRRTDGRMDRAAELRRKARRLRPAAEFSTNQAHQAPPIKAKASAAAAARILEIRVVHPTSEVVAEILAAAVETPTAVAAAEIRVADRARIFRKRSLFPVLRGEGWGEGSVRAAVNCNRAHLAPLPEYGERESSIAAHALLREPRNSFIALFTVRARRRARLLLQFVRRFFEQAHQRADCQQHE